MYGTHTQPLQVYEHVRTYVCTDMYVYVHPLQVVMGLLDMVISYKPTDKPLEGTAHKYKRFASEVAHKALNLMAMLRPVTVVTTLAKEVAMYLASQHVTHFPHSSLQPLQVGVQTRPLPPPPPERIITFSY